MAGHWEGRVQMGQGRAGHAARWERIASEPPWVMQCPPKAISPTGDRSDFRLDNSRPCRGPWGFLGHPVVMPCDLCLLTFPSAPQALYITWDACLWVLSALAGEDSEEYLLLRLHSVRPTPCTN